nr:ORF I polyprotein [Ipomoea batatas]
MQKEVREKGKRKFEGSSRGGEKNSKMSQGEAIRDYQRSGIPRPRRDFPTQSTGMTSRGWMKERHFYCKRCGKDHPGVDCIGMPVECFNCGKKGHRSFECQTSRREGSFRSSQSQEKTQQYGIQVKARNGGNMANTKEVPARAPHQMQISHQTLMSTSSHGAMNILKKGEPIGKSDCSDTMEVTCYNHMVQDWPEELNWIFWYLCHEYHILMEFHRPSLRKELDLSVEKDLIKFLTWFYPLKYWKKLCQDGPEFFTVHLHREVTAWVSRFLEGHAEPFMKIYEQHMESIIVREEDYPEFQRYIFAQNKVIPKEIWPREGIQPDVRQDDEIYYERIKSARNQYYYELSQVKKEEDIWSQDPGNFDDIDLVLE